MADVTQEIPFEKFDIDNDIEGSGVSNTDTFNRWRLKTNGIINYLKSLKAQVDAGDTNRITISRLPTRETSFGMFAAHHNGSNFSYVTSDGALNIQYLAVWHGSTSIPDDALPEETVGGGMVISSAPFNHVKQKLFITQTGTITTAQRDAHDSISITDWRLVNIGGHYGVTGSWHLYALDSFGNIWSAGFSDHATYSALGILIDAGNEPGSYAITSRKAHNSRLHQAMSSNSGSTEYGVFEGGRIIHPCGDCYGFLALDKWDRLWYTGAATYGMGIANKTVNSGAEVSATSIQFYSNTPGANPSILSSGTTPDEGFTNPHITNFRIKEAAWCGNHSDLSGDTNVTGPTFAVIRFNDASDQSSDISPTVADHNTRATEDGGINDPGGCVQTCGSGSFGEMGNASVTSTNSSWKKVTLPNTLNSVDISACTIEKIYMCGFQGGASGGGPPTVYLLLRASGQTEGYDYIVAWGYNWSGRMGDGSADGTYSTPKLVWKAGSTSTYAAVSGGTSFVMPRITKFGTNSSSGAFVVGEDGYVYFTGNNISDIAGLTAAPNDVKPSAGIVTIQQWTPAGYQSSTYPAVDIDDADDSDDGRVYGIIDMFLSGDIGRSKANINTCRAYFIQERGESDTEDRQLWYSGTYAWKNSADVYSSFNMNGLRRCMIPPTTINKLTNVILTRETFEGASDINGYYGNTYYTKVVGLLSSGDMISLTNPDNSLGAQGSYDSITL